MSLVNLSLTLPIQFVIHCITWLGVAVKVWWVWSNSELQFIIIRELQYFAKYKALKISCYTIHVHVFTSTCTDK